MAASITRLRQRGETQTYRPSLFLTETPKGEAAFPCYPPPSGLTPCMAVRATSASSPLSSSCSQHLHFALIFRQIHPGAQVEAFRPRAEAGGEKQGGEGGLVRRWALTAAPPCSHYSRAASVLLQRTTAAMPKATALDVS